MKSLKRSEATIPREQARGRRIPGVRRGGTLATIPRVSHGASGFTGESEPCRTLQGGWITKLNALS